MNDAISVLIVEDEDLWAKTLLRHLDHMGFRAVATVSNTEDALEAFSAHHYDVALVDIHLNGKNSGIRLGQLLHEVHHKPFIFVTANADSHSIREASVASPSAYLIKPIDPSSLFAAIHNAIYNYSHRLAPSPPGIKEPEIMSFFVKQGKRYRKINWQDIVYLCSGKNYISLFNAADNSEYHIRASLQKTLQQLVPRQLQPQFVQVNRSEAVQIPFIREIVSDEIITDYKSFFITEGYSSQLRKQLNIIA